MTLVLMEGRYTFFSVDISEPNHFTSGRLLSACINMLPL